MLRDVLLEVKRVTGPVTRKLRVTGPVTQIKFQRSPSRRVSGRMSGNATGGKGSKRWQHFYAALQLAIQRSAHKWT